MKVAMVGEQEGGQAEKIGSFRRGGPVDFGVQELKNAHIPKDESWNPFDILLP